MELLPQSRLLTFRCLILWGHLIRELRSQAVMNNQGSLVTTFFSAVYVSIVEHCLDFGNKGKLARHCFSSSPFQLSRLVIFPSSLQRKNQEKPRKKEQMFKGPI